MISKGSLVRTPERVDGSEGDVCVVVSDPYPEWHGGQDTVELFVSRVGQVRSYYVHALRLISE
jgi:hypothetical protein